jgi:hypothetical protein
MWRRHVPPKLLLTLSSLHGVISQKTELFKRLLSSSQFPDRLWGPSSLLLYRYHCLFPLAMKLEHSLSFTDEVEHMWRYSSTFSCVFMGSRLIKYGGQLYRLAFHLVDFVL